MLSLANLDRSIHQPLPHIHKSSGEGPPRSLEFTKNTGPIDKASQEEAESRRFYFGQVLASDSGYEAMSHDS